MFLWSAGKTKELVPACDQNSENLNRKQIISFE